MCMCNIVAVEKSVKLNNSKVHYASFYNQVNLPQLTAHDLFITILTV